MLELGHLAVSMDQLHSVNSCVLEFAVVIMIIKYGRLNDVLIYVFIQNVISPTVIKKPFNSYYFMNNAITDKLISCNCV